MVVFDEYLAVLGNLMLTLCLLGNFACFFVVCQFYKKILSGIPLECQKVWIKIRPDQVQAVCKGYQQVTLEGKVLVHG